MPISFGSSSADAKPYVRANLPQNRWWVKSDAGEEPINMDSGFAIDIKNVVFGWLHIDIGVRDWQPWPSPSQQIAKPSDAHKQGFEVDCWLSDGREASFSGNSYRLGQFIAKLYNQCETSPEFAQGKIPVVQITTSKPVVIGKGTSYDVGFVIRTWIDKPSGQAADHSASPVPQPAPQSEPVAEPAATSTNFGF